MEIVAFIYLLGVVPAYLALRFALIRLSGVEGRTAGDAVLNMLCCLCSWITVVVALILLGILAVGDIERRETKLF